MYSNLENDNLLIQKLLYESINFDQATAYKSGFLLSIITIFYYSINSLFRKSTYLIDPDTLNKNVTLCFWQFLNEKNAIDFEIKNGSLTYFPIEINPRKCRGLNWRKVFWQNPFLIFKFIYLVKKNLGIKKVKSFSYGYIGYLVYYHLIKMSRCISEFNATILTANMVSPISVAINEFGRVKTMRTHYLEHAITPKSILHGMQYDKYIVRLKHTKFMLIETGVLDRDIILNNNYKYNYPPVLFKNLPFKDIGIAINDEDRIDTIFELIKILVESNYNVFIRVHDGDKRFHVFENIANKIGANIESAKIRHINEYLNKVDFIFVGNTTVILDAVIHNIPVCYIWPGKPYVYDYYGFVKEIMCPVYNKITRIEDIFSFYYNNVKKLH